MIAAPGGGRGSIPACAGETKAACTGGIWQWVYPRVCGGNAAIGANPNPSKGLSPRVRGKLRAGGGLAQGAGSIPACAGETPARRHPCRPAEVYPRVCGGNPLAMR